MIPYAFFEHTADRGVRIQGPTLPELFANAAQALYAALGQLAKTGPPRETSIDLRAGTLEDLLHDWLTELLFAVETHQVLYDECEILNCTPSCVRANLRGAGIDFGRSKVHAEIKAVTYHQLRVEQLPDRTWQATVIFDI